MQIVEAVCSVRSSPVRKQTTRHAREAIREFELRPVLAQSVPVSKKIKPLDGAAWLIKVKQGEENLWPNVDMRPPYAIVTVLKEIRPAVFEVWVHRPLPVSLEAPVPPPDSPASIDSSQPDLKPKRQRKLNPLIFNADFVWRQSHACSILIRSKGGITSSFG